MSRPARFVAEIPEETRHLVESLLPADTVYRQFDKEIDRIVRDTHVRYQGTSPCESCGVGLGLEHPPEGVKSMIETSNEPIPPESQD